MWNVETTDRFDDWFFEQTTALKEDVLATMHILAEFGPNPGATIRRHREGFSLCEHERVTYSACG